MVELALNYDHELEPNEKTRFESSMCAKLLLLSNSVVQKFFFDINQERETGRKKSSMNLIQQEGLSSNQGMSVKEKPIKPRYNPIKQPKGDDGDADWFSDRVPVRPKKSPVKAEEKFKQEELEDEEGSGEDKGFDMDNFQNLLNEFNKIEQEEKDKQKEEMESKIENEEEDVNNFQNLLNEYNKLEQEEIKEEIKLENVKEHVQKKNLSWNPEVISFPPVESIGETSPQKPEGKKVTLRPSFDSILSLEEIDKFPSFNSEDPSSPKGILESTNFLTLKKTGSLILDADQTYKPYSNKQEDKKEKKIYSVTDNFKDMLVRTMRVCPIEDSLLYKNVPPIKLEETAGNNLFQLLNGLFYVQPFSILKFFSSLVNLDSKYGSEEEISPQQTQNLESLSNLMKYCSMPDFLFTMINLAEVELSEKDSRLKKRQQKILNDFYRFIQILMEKFVESLFKPYLLKDGVFDYDTAVDQEIVNENIFRLFWNVSIHVMLAEEFESLESNVCVAKFMVSESLFKIIKDGMTYTRERYIELFSKGGKSEFIKDFDGILEQQTFSRGLRTNLRFLQLLNGIYSYFMTGKPSFQLKLNLSKEGELKIPEFYSRIIDNFETFEDFYQSNDFKKVSNFNAEYIYQNKFIFQERFKTIVDFEYLNFLLQKVSTDWNLKTKGSRTDATGAEVPILGYENLTILEYIVGLFELHNKLKKKETQDNSPNKTKSSFPSVIEPEEISIEDAPKLKTEQELQIEQYIEHMMVNMVKEFYKLISVRTHLKLYLTLIRTCSVK